MNARANTVVSVHVGKIVMLGDSGKPSAFIKTEVAGPVAAGALGLAGDEQADKRFHGGPDKAVYGYDVGSYGEWSAAFPALRFGPGSMGENLAIAGFDEVSVCIGDIHRIGSVLLQVTQPRQPCWKLAAVFGEPLLVRAMFQNGRTGWYYRVLGAGVLAAGDAAELVDHCNGAWTIRRLADFTVARHRPPEEVREMLSLPGLPDGLRRKAQTWLDPA